MKVRELLDGPEKWTKGLSARDASGSMVDVDSPYAVCWCLYGAMQRCYGLGTVAISAAYGKVAALVGSVVAWNDAPQRTFADVKDTVDYLDI